MRSCVSAPLLNTILLASCSMATTDITIDNLNNITQDYIGTGNVTRFFENATTALFENATTVLAPSTTNGKRFYEYDIFLTALQLYKNAWKVIVPPGLFGNMIIIIANAKMKPFNSTSLFMISLALVDLSTLCTRIPMKEIRLETTFVCQVMWYLYNALPMYSNYILLFWTLERVILVQFPLRASAWCTVKRTAIVIAATGVFSFGINVAWPVSIVSQSRGSSCTTSEGMTDFIVNVWQKVDSSLFVFIPMIIIILSNIVIITRLQQSTKRHHQMTSSNEARLKRERDQRNTTITLIVVCIAFVVLHMPLAIYNCFALSQTRTRNQETIANWEFVNAFGLTMAELQNSLSFYLYFLTGRRYRQVTFSILFPCRRRPCRRQRKTDRTIAQERKLVDDTAFTVVSVVSSSGGKNRNIVN